MSKKIESKGENEGAHVQVLYRKYRPQTFDEVVNQDQVVNVLKTSLDKKSLSHAYLFHGGRGTGKTSIARILARELGTTPNDLYEIDAASNRGIDDIRELREGVRTVPFESKYKVYIIDEAHMLTKEAFNALLKTLEEPPPHAIFILATTELDKLPETIVSRCEVHGFREPHNAILGEMVKKIAKAEGYELEAGGAEVIALLGEGSFRDTLGGLQKVLASFLNKGEGKKKIGLEEIENILGAPKRVLVRDFVRAFVEKNKEKSLAAFQKAIESNGNPKVFLELVLHVMRMGLLLKISKNSKEFVSGHVGTEDLKFLEELIVSQPNSFNSKILLSLLTAYETMSRSPVPELGIEIAIDEITSKE